MALLFPPLFLPGLLPRFGELSLRATGPTLALSLGDRISLPLFPLRELSL